MQIEAITADPAPSRERTPRTRVNLTVRAGSDRYNLFFAAAEDVLVFTPESFIALSILPAMKLDLPVDLESEASARLLRAVPTIQQIYRMWGVEGPDNLWTFAKRGPMRLVEIRGAVPVDTPRRPVRRTASFFSGGVDSWYTLLKHQDQITDLIFVHGFDIRLDDSPLRTAAARTVHEVGASLGKRVIEIETNLRDFLNPHVGWGLSHGAALATIAHQLSHCLDRVFVPATYTYMDLFPWGSHPVLDALWSTEGLEIVHDGCEAWRVEKVAKVAQSDLAMRTLRVCYVNPGSAYNCGRCEKCLRTMVSLRIAGALDRCETFPAALDIDRIRLARPMNQGARAFVRQNLLALKAKRIDAELQAALEDLLAPPPFNALRLVAKRALASFPRLDSGVRAFRGMILNSRARTTRRD